MFTPFHRFCRIYKKALVRREQADKLLMTAHVAYGIAIATIGLLAWFGAHNHRSGWRRQRSDDLTDALVQWAASRSMSVSNPVRSQQPAASLLAPSLVTDLSALNLAVGMSAGIASEPNRSEPSRATDGSRQSATEVQVEWV